MLLEQSAILYFFVNQTHTGTYFLQYCPNWVFIEVKLRTSRKMDKNDVIWDKNSLAANYLIFWTTSYKWKRVECYIQIESQ